MVSTIMAQFQEHCSVAALEGTIPEDTVRTGSGRRKRHKDRKYLGYIRNKGNVVVLECHHGHSVMGDKAGRRKWRSLLQTEEVRDHTQMPNYLLGVHCC